MRKHIITVCLLLGLASCRSSHQATESSAIAETSDAIIETSAATTTAMTADSTVWEFTLPEIITWQLADSLGKTVNITRMRAANARKRRQATTLAQHHDTTDMRVAESSFDCKKTAGNRTVKQEGKDFFRTFAALFVVIVTLTLILRRYAKN